MSSSASARSTFTLRYGGRVISVSRSASYYAVIEHARGMSYALQLIEPSDITLRSSSFPGHTDGVITREKWAGLGRRVRVVEVKVRRREPPAASTFRVPSASASTAHGPIEWARGDWLSSCFTEVYITVEALGRNGGEYPVRVHLESRVSDFKEFLQGPLSLRRKFGPARRKQLLFEGQVVPGYLTLEGAGIRANSRVQLAYRKRKRDTDTQA
ncbi:unnamed protein product [Peniophora sp. CBMAI 1063]|nr:unnamed protein product [Peniophora sp. CBMAI 1063]